MDKQELHRRVFTVVKSLENCGDDERIYAARIFIKAAYTAISGAKPILNELETEKKRNKLQRKETELAPKPPIKPVKSTEPHKPKKPKCNGL